MGPNIVNWASIKIRYRPIKETEDIINNSLINFDGPNQHALGLE